MPDNIFQTYFKSIQESYLSDNESSEHTYRTALEILLKSFEKEIIKRNLTIIHEPTSQQGLGRPDFKITTKEQLTIGLLETKKIGEDLSKILDSDQLKRYRQLSDNIILTDYLQFYLIKNGEIILDSSIFRDYEIKNKRHKVPETRIIEITKLLKLFFESEPDTIYKTQDLALKLSICAIILKEYSYAVLQEEEEEEKNLLQGLYEVFQDTLLPLLDKKYFADIYAQTLTYGLFLAALNCDDPRKQLKNRTAYSLLPNTFPLIKELFHQLEDFPKDIVWAIDEIITILKVTDFSAIKKEFAEYRHKEKGFNDPFIYFYQDFLKHYDKTQRELKGVYYTPEPVVSFIVRSIEVILKNTFDIKSGFSGENVTVLDFACGTGTFLLYVFKQALEQARNIGNKHAINKVLNDQLIKNFVGFELLVAPYVIAHLKVSEFFKEQGFSIEQGNRLNIYLTNTLINEKPHPFPTMPALSKEGNEANKIKNKDILVILGNPPYSIHSENKSEFILHLLKDYKPKDERKFNLDDDYIKFIRFAHWKMEHMKKGIIGIITNNSYLGGITHRKMRSLLIKDFNEIYILNLHGDYLEDENISSIRNVFDITVGVTITFFIKNASPSPCKIFYKEIIGSRISKYQILENSVLNKREFDLLEYQKFNTLFNTTKWKKRYDDDLNFFLPVKKLNFIFSYGNFWGITDIFNKNSVGIKTKVDTIAIDLNIDKLKKRIKDILSNDYPFSEIISKYNISQKTTWEYNRVNKSKFSNEKFVEYDYRPFDKRYIFYDNDFLSRSRKEIMDNFYNKSNLGLEVARLDDFVSFVSTNISDEHFGGGSSYKFPLYLFNDENGDNSNGNNFLFKDDGKKDNFSKEFRKFIKEKYKRKYTPLQILGYIYAILYSQTYRTKYFEFLKIDFPRIPFTDDEKMFKTLSAIGEELIEHHLLMKSEGNICHLKGTGGNDKVEKIEYEKGKVWFNKDQYFESIPDTIWNFHIGSYQVLDKWLKERKKHEIILSGIDIRHFIKVVNVLDYTIKTMEKIDEKTREWI